MLYFAYGSNLKSFSNEKKMQDSKYIKKLNLKILN